MRMKITIVTPIYNREDCILRCLESVRGSIIPTCEVEHIIVDDGSTDNTGFIIKEFAKKNNYVKYIRFDKNKGTNAARNKAISIANGEYCVFLDSDDYFDNCIFSVITKTISSHPEIKHFCFSPDHMVKAYESNNLLKNSNTKLLTYEDFLVERVGGDFFHVMRTDILQRHPFNEELRIHEGVFFLALYKEAQNILFTNIVVNHIELGRNDTVKRETFRNNRSTIKNAIQADVIFLKNYKEDLEHIKGGEKIIHRHLLSIYENYLLLGDYVSAKQTSSSIKKLQYNHIPLKLKIIHLFHLGSSYSLAARLYLWFKYDILKKEIL